MVLMDNVTGAVTAMLVIAGLALAMWSKMSGKPMKKIIEDLMKNE